MFTGLRYGQPLLAQPISWATVSAGVVAGILLLSSTMPTRHLISRALASTQRILKHIILQSSIFVYGFKYNDSVDGQHIRLLRLPYSTTSKTSSSRPQMTVHTFPLDKCPDYLALSYTWGPPDSSCPAYTPRDRLGIQLDGRFFAIRPNLLHALQQVSAVRPGCYIWVDSICINQNNTQERAAQVSNMDHIYTGAIETLIWLGPASERSARAVDIVKKTAVDAEQKILNWTSTQTYGNAFLPNDTDLLVRNGLPPLTAEDWNDMADIFTRSWFGRVWMVQEVALSRNPTVLIGNHELPWDVIGHTSLVVGLSNVLVGLFTTGQSQNGPLVMGIIHSTGLQIAREWSKGASGKFQGVIDRANFSAGIDTHHPSSHLLRLLLSTVGFHATFRRDRVYSLLGIANHLSQMQGQDRLSLEIDYKSTDDQVLTSFGLSLFRNTQSLHLLSHAGLAGRGVESNMPTWIPSFEAVNAPILGPNYTNLQLFNASKAEPGDVSRFTINEERMALHVKAITPNLGTIEEFGEPWGEMLHGKFTSCLKILLHCGDTYRFTNQPIVEAFWRTLIMDYDMIQRPAPSHLAQSFAAWMKLVTVTAIFGNYASNTYLHDLFDTVEPLWVLANSRDTTGLLPKSIDLLTLLDECGMVDYPPAPKISESERAAMIESWGKESAQYDAFLRLTLQPNRRLARTVRGYLCLVPSSAKVGDNVMIVSGCPTPLVLRRVKSREDYFNVVGDTYVHGAMFGEHISSHNCVWRVISLA
ncbi:heterokaryon incompatibility protein-domain-containing protein [Thelonectria olida]|uniref:Heterokaryon incompatibility protein-domain-containing protein n=1 Tax=Thelonectria olida TaxID=1576542 RepID=A0A9P8W8J3_9HYPO|nr:heterokaryon incompatibility protein-domain-containing protein [Thelonectria olida]